MGRRPTFCQSFIAFLLKFLNYLQTFVGVSILIYSAFILHHWHDHGSVPPPQPHPEPPPPVYYSSSSLHPKVETFDDITRLNLDLELKLPADAVLSDLSLSDEVQFSIHPLPAPWFMYAFMGVGVVLCCITFIGHVAAEAGCCLCSYAILSTLSVTLELFLVAFIAIDRQWEKDLPVDSTGELDRLRTFFEENRDVCEWICISVIIIQVLSLLLAIILRALVNQRTDLDNEGAYDSRERPWEPLLHPHLSEASGSIRIDGRGTHSDIWSPRMREKYGLNGGDNRQHFTNQNVAVDRDPRH